MSTRSYICIETESTKITGEMLGIYCHWDGYPEHNGQILVNHYKDREKVKRLIALGDLSSLAPNIDPEPNTAHSFKDPQDNVCVAYGRDRGEENTQPKIVTLENLCSDDSWIEYVYIYTLEGEWVFYDTWKYKEWLEYKEVCEKNDEAYYESDWPQRLAEYDENLDGDGNDNIDDGLIGLTVMMATDAALNALFGQQDDIRITARLSTEDDVDDNKITE